MAFSWSQEHIPLPRLRQYLFYQEHDTDFSRKRPIKAQMVIFNGCASPNPLPDSSKPQGEFDSSPRPSHQTRICVN